MPTSDPLDDEEEEKLVLDKEALQVPAESYEELDVNAEDMNSHFLEIIEHNVCLSMNMVV